MRNPNGYGSIIKLKGKRRKPYAARKTIGWNENGNPIYKYIGYYETRELAMIELANYNKNPWDLESEKITVSELFQLWLNKKFNYLGKTNKASLKSAYKHIKPLYEMQYSNIKSFHMQEIINNCGLSYSSQNNIKNLFYHLDRFALEIDVINKCYSQLVTTEFTPMSNKKPFTDEEVQLLWDNTHLPYVDTVLIFIYTGFRISELLELKIENVDLDNNILKGGTKTKAGKDRVVPIHPKILPLIRLRYNAKNEYLIYGKNHNLSKTKYYMAWRYIMDSLNLKHTPHECRHTFRSNLDRLGANKRCIDLLMGHQSKDVGERIYTHKTIDELTETILLLK